MPADFELDRDARLVRSRVWGALTEADLVEHVRRVRELFEQGTLDRTWAQVCDFSGTASLEDVTAAGVRYLATSNPWPPESIRVFIATKDEVYGLSRMYQILAGGDSENFRVVASRADAIAWFTARGRALGLDGARPAGADEVPGAR